MKTSILSFSLVAALILGAAIARVSAQFGVPNLSPVQQLQALKAKNQILLDKQTATLQKLDELELQSQQVKFLGKRS